MNPKEKKTPSSTELNKHGLLVSELLQAGTVLKKVSNALRDHYKNVGGHDFPREWMQEHLKRRAALIQTMMVLCDMGEELEKVNTTNLRE